MDKDELRDFTYHVYEMSEKEEAPAEQRKLLLELAKFLRMEWGYDQYDPYGFVGEFAALDPANHEEKCKLAWQAVKAWEGGCYFIKNK